MSGPENRDDKWGGEGQSEPTRIIPNPLPQSGQQPYNPQPWSQNPATGQPSAPPPPPPAQGGWGQPQQQTPAWGTPQQPPPGPPPGQQPTGQPAWGQPPQPPPQPGWGPPPGPNQWQQPGQPDQWQQPGHPDYGQAPQSTGGKSKLPLILALAGVAALLVVVVGAVLFMNRSQVLDAAAVQDGVTDILTNSYGIQGVSNVECPADQAVESGTSFTCDVSVDGEARTVTIRVIDDEGTYEVSKPQ